MYQSSARCTRKKKKKRLGQYNSNNKLISSAQERGLKIRSYTLELMTIHAARSRGSVSTLPLFRDVLRLLQDCGSLRIAFDDNYKSRDFTRLVLLL